MTEKIQLLLIILTGLVTTYTDLKQRKIKNGHLIALGCAALAVEAAAAYRSGHWPAMHVLLNPVVGLGIGVALYLGKMWRAGDAKLFFIYSLVIPTSSYQAIFPFASLVVFANTFLLATAAILPVFINDIIQKRGVLINEIMQKKTAETLMNSFLISFGLTWLLSPFISSLGLHNNLFLAFVILYLGYMLVYRLVDVIRKNTLVWALVLGTGFLFRFWWQPQSFAVTQLLSYTLRLGLFTFSFFFLRLVDNVTKEQSKRVPLSPFLFAGSLLTYTGFLRWAISLMSR